MATQRSHGPMGMSSAPPSFDLGTLCRGCSPISAVLGHSTGIDVSQWPIERKLLEAARRSMKFLPHEAAEQLEQLFTKENLEITGAVLAAAVGAQFVPVGGEIIDAALVGVGYYFLGDAALSAIKCITAYFKAALNAKTEHDLDTAAREFARAVSIVGVGTVVTIVLKNGSKVLQDQAYGAAGPRGLSEGSFREKLKLDRQTYKGWPDLPSSETPNFRSPEPDFLAPGTKLYRVFDGTQGNIDRPYWMLERPAAEDIWRSQSAVKEHWNPGLKIAEATVGPQGAKVWKGEASAQVYRKTVKINGKWVEVLTHPDGRIYAGGGVQVYIQDRAVLGNLRVSDVPWTRKGVVGPIPSRQDDNDAKSGPGSAPSTPVGTMKRNQP